MCGNHSIAVLFYCLVNKWTNWSSFIRYWITSCACRQAVTWSSVRDLSRWFLHWVGGLVRICLSFLSTLAFSNSSLAYVLERFLGQLETIVWIERSAWEIGKFFWSPRKEMKRCSHPTQKSWLALVNGTLLTVKYIETCKVLVNCGLPYLADTGNTVMTAIASSQLCARHVSELITSRLPMP